MSDIYPLSPHHAASQAIGTTISFRSGITAVPRRADVPDHMDKRIRGLRPLPGNIKIIVCAVRIVAMLYCVQRTAYSGECLYSVQVPNMTQAVATGGSWGVEGTQARCDQHQCQCSVSHPTH